MHPSSGFSRKVKAESSEPWKKVAVTLYGVQGQRKPSGGDRSGKKIGEWQQVLTIKEQCKALGPAGIRE